MTSSDPTGGASVRRALLSVSDKNGLVPFTRALHELGVELLASGGTHRALAEAGLPVREVSDYTEFPEIMGGRVKTLHPRVHGGILRRPGVDDAVCAEHGIDPIDLVVVNLYPFEATAAQAGASFEDVVEQIDIGGPALVRGAAKNHANTLVVVDPDDYEGVLERLRGGAVDAPFRRDLARRAFAHTAAYDLAITRWFEGVEPSPPGTDEVGSPWTPPARLTLGLTRTQTLRYGENPHQSAALYAEAGAPPSGWQRARQVQGKALSYNNIADADAALRAVALFPEPACVIIKHANPCGAALGQDPLDAYRRAFATDPTSAFGGIIAFNRGLDGATLEAILEQQFVEVVVAPEVYADAAEAAARRRNVRLLEWGWDGFRDAAAAELVLRPVSGGWLAQSADTLSGLDALRCPTRRKPEERERVDLVFAWRVATVVKSNAIVYAADGRTLGVGAGQMSRVDSARIGRWKAADAGLDLTGAVLASDAFFPFRDGVDTAAEAGVKAIIQPGGSVRDEEVIAAADEHGIAMLFTGVRHFHH